MTKFQQEQVDAGWEWNDDLWSYVPSISEGRYAGFFDVEVSYAPKLVIGFQLGTKPRFRVRARSVETKS